MRVAAVGFVLICVALLWIPERVYAADGEKKRVIVYSVCVDGRDGTKMYDGSRNVELVPEAYWEGGKPDMEQAELEVRGYARSSDAGIWKVDVEYELTGPKADDYVLECRSAAMEARVEIVPKILSVWIADGVKFYNSGSEADDLIFEEGVQPVTVTGFMKDGAVTDEIPAEFELPVPAVDEQIVTKESPIYRDGKYICYKEALTLKGENGAAGGAANYRYALEDTRYTRKGNLTLKEEVLSQEKYRIAAKCGSFLWDAKKKKYRAAAGTILRAEPVQGSGYNQAVESEPLNGSGTWSFCLERRGKQGGLLARTQRLTLAYETDGNPPCGSVLLEGRKRKRYRTNQECRCSIADVEDDFPGEIAVAWYLSEEKMQSETLADEEGWIEADSMSITEEGNWYPYVRLRDAVGNTAYLPASKVIIDRTPPKLSISGVKEGGILTGNFKVDFSVEDETAGVKKSSLELYRRGLETEEKMMLNIQTEKNTKSFGMWDASGKRLPDGWYILRISGTDQAGNKAGQEISFSVNQEGPQFQTDRRTEIFFAKDCAREGQDIIILAKDVNEIKSCRILCSCNGGFYVLEEKKDYRTESRMLADGTREYRYAIGREIFQKEGVYQLVLSADDEAGNRGKSDMQDFKAVITIDRTPPVCLIDPLKQEDECIKIAVSCEDNYRFSKLCVYKNERLVCEMQKEDCELELSFRENARWRLEAFDTVGNKEVTHVSGEELVKLLQQKELLLKNKKEDMTRSSEPERNRKREGKKQKEEKKENAQENMRKDGTADGEEMKEQEENYRKVKNAGHGIKYIFFICALLAVLAVWKIVRKERKRFR